ncbi:hypothetical protein NE235_19805 [Actinoallomurus spadix]|uniref:Uncharacterized protein n=1 Tax=Actinoallomurus spadix TaxID=79912 RepID=A0ABN0XQ36_9ACTN|nr:hypothetical protein [Actinoallomurus spadix]MCO5988353.1 hypothetical protein [Actinoallomurus spadix]
MQHGPGHPSDSPYSPVTAPGRELAALGHTEDPVARPLTYPGRRPPRSGLLVDGCLLDLRPVAPRPVVPPPDRPYARPAPAAAEIPPDAAPGAMTEAAPGAVPEAAAGMAARAVDPAASPAAPPPGSWLVDASAVPPHVFGGGPEVPLDEALRACGGPVMADRRPVLAIGSNASPAQLVRKLAARTRVVVPMTYARVSGLTAGASAHVSRPGYVPAVPVLTPGASTDLVVLWLDDEQLTAVDRTEPNYHRVRLPAPVTAELPGLGPVHCHLYAGRHGCLTGEDGVPIRLARQPDLLAGLLAASPRLARLTGARSPAEFVARTRADARLRDEVRRLWRHEGIVLDQPELVAGPLTAP